MTIEKLLFAQALFAALGCGLVAGVFLAFSTFVMQALERLPSEIGIAAMQSINLAVLRSGFILVFLTTAADCLLAVVVGVARWREPESPYLIVGGLLYLVGTFLVTMVCNVPRNAALMSLRLDDPSAADDWARYIQGWTRWNHVRTAAALAAAACFILALGR